MKLYICKLCKRRGKNFRGIRPAVREHLREEHNIKGVSKGLNILSDQKTRSPLTLNTLTETI